MKAQYPNPGLGERRASARAYIDSLRNAAKREYGEAYYRLVICNGLPEPEPVGLSYMGAQAVRLSLATIMRGER